MVLAHESFVLAWFLIESRNRPISLVTTASDEDPCAHPERFVRWGATLTTFFPFLFRVERIHISLKAGHHRPAREAPFKWRFDGGADDGLTLNAGLVAWGVFRTPCPPSGSAHGTGQCIYLLRYTENYDLIVRIGFCTMICVLSFACAQF